jgi:hypothetical protein
LEDKNNAGEIRVNFFTFKGEKYVEVTTKQNQTTESQGRIKYIPMEYQFLPPDYGATGLAAKM